jgi:hypothetical protein
MIHAMDDMSQGLVENVKEKLGIKRDDRGHGPHGLRMGYRL